MLRGGRMVKEAGLTASYAPSLAGSVFLGITFWAGSAGQTFAADECGVDGAGATIISCAANTYASGIAYPNTADAFTLTLNDAGIDVTDIGVSVVGSGANTGAIIINAPNFGSISTMGKDEYGLHAQTGGLGAGTITLGSGSLSTAGKDAYGAYSRITNAASTAASSVTMTGGIITTTGKGSIGLYALTDGLGASTVTLGGGSLSTGGQGTYGAHSQVTNAASVAASSVTMTGGTTTTTGQSSIGLYALTDGLGTSTVALGGGTLSTGGQSAYGAYAQITNAASTATSSVTMTGGTITTTGNSGHGLFAQTLGTGLASVSVTGNAVVTASHTHADGVRAEIAQATATYSILVDDTATVTAGAGNGAGIRTQSVLGSAGTIIIGTGTTIDGSASSGPGGGAIVDGAGDTTVTVAGRVIGDIKLGSGSDALTFTGANLSGITLFDGGDDSSTADGFIDTLTFQDSNLAGANVRNWEAIVIGTGSTISFAGNTLMTGLVTINASGILDATGGALTIAGDVHNDGIITTHDGITGDILTVSGDYSGGGHLLLDVNLTTGVHDMFVVVGDVTGAPTIITVTNVSHEAPTDNDIPIVEVDGESHAGDFVLDGPVHGGGAFDYEPTFEGPDLLLHHGDHVNSTGAVYEATSAVLLGLAALPSLEQRRHNRQWRVQNHAGGQQGVWMRAHGERLHEAPRSSTAEMHYDSTTWGIQAGVDVATQGSGQGHWVFGITAQYGVADADVMNSHGSGHIEATGYSLGGTATWYSDGGTYIDVQGQTSWLDSDISSSTEGAEDIGHESHDHALLTGHSSRAYALSTEFGHQIAVGARGTLVPQGQWSWGNVTGDTVIDHLDNDVSLGASRLSARAGLAYEYAFKDDHDGPEHHGKAYVIGNILYDLSGTQSAMVVGKALRMKAQPIWGELGLGGAIEVTNNIHLYGEGSYRRSLSGNARDNTGYGMTAGLHMQW